MPKRINGGKMKKILISVMALVALAACVEQQPEQDQYFDHITPVPTNVSAKQFHPFNPFLRPQRAWMQTA